MSDGNVIDWANAPLLDGARLRDYAELLPPDQVARLTRAFARELETRPSMILHLARQGDGANARAAAHLLKGAALSVGGERIAALAGAIERAGEGDLLALAQEMPGCALDTLSEVAALERLLSG